MAITQYYVDPAIAGNSGTGTIGDPFGDLQYALDTVGAGVGRNATDGDQFNIKAGTAEILAASLTLATYGTPTAIAPLILRGYTAIANDGGRGDINCNGFKLWGSTNYDHLKHVQLTIRNGAADNLLDLRDNITVDRCIIHQTGVSVASKALVQVRYYALVTGCYLYDAGAWNNNYCIQVQGGFVTHNYVIAGTQANEAVRMSGNTHIIHVYGNIVVIANSSSGNGVISSFSNQYNSVTGNIVYSTIACTKPGINLSTNQAARVANNIVVGFSGAGGTGIYVSDVNWLGYNAFYNNTTNYTLLDRVFIDETANDVVLAADPFTNAAAGDFSLTAAAKAALASKGFPTAYLGAHASTVPNLNVGPIQLAATAPVAATRGRLIIPRR